MAETEKETECLPMVANRDFVVLSDDWNGLPTSTIHLFRRLLRTNRVFWMRIVNRLPKLHIADLRKVVDVAISRNRERALRQGPISLGTSAPLQRTPLVIPYYRRPIRQMNRLILQRTYRSICQKYSVKDPILFTTFPSTADFMATADASCKIYYCVDDWSNYPGLDQLRMNSMERELIRSVDGVVATSRKLQQKAEGICRSQYLPQGVDFSHFRSASDRSCPISVMDRIPKPIVGFFGFISDWIDLELIAELSCSFPKVSWVLIGGSDVPLGILANRPNVFSLGPVAYEKLPDWAKYFDVGLIPFRDTELTRAVNPLKLLEYFALGLPVLASRLPELEAQEGPVFLAANAAEFSRSLQDILSASPGRYRDQAIAVAKHHTWDHRLSTLSQFIQALER